MPLVCDFQRETLIKDEVAVAVSNEEENAVEEGFGEPLPAAPGSPAVAVDVVGEYQDIVGDVFGEEGEQEEPKIGDDFLPASGSPAVSDELFEDSVEEGRNEEPEIGNDFLAPSSSPEVSEERVGDVRRNDEVRSDANGDVTNPQPIRHAEDLMDQSPSIQRGSGVEVDAIIPSGGDGEEQGQGRHDSLERNVASASSTSDHPDSRVHAEPMEISGLYNFTIVNHFLGSGPMLVNH